MIVPGEKTLLLPVEPAGYGEVAHPGNNAALLQGYAWAGLRALLTEPGLVMPLLRPSKDELCGAGYDPATAMPAHNPRAVATAVALCLPHGRVWGVGRFVLIEGGLRPGSTQLLKYDVTWTEAQDDAEVELAELVTTAAESVRIGPEPNAKPWRRVTALLGDASVVVPKPANWQRSLQLAAGLRMVKLEVRTSPDSNKAAIIRDLRTKPPDALLIWAGARPPLKHLWDRTSQPGAPATLTYSVALNPHPSASTWQNS
ncbi:MAG: hypothetical protein IRZ08_01410 [Frankia sp.]|nr:hypothetical protein [Frankia sp.]